MSLGIAAQSAGTASDAAGFKALLLTVDTAVYSQVDIEVLLDRVCAALARYGTPRAWRAMVPTSL